ncbi:cation:proton antiporter regulatory subunit [Prauserella muralis]|uniref:cation:proton antiporter regulatory subunit n=1 Tax=Prauserella muralis TaxID=588067 RepID=UPI000DD34547|nr:TrkA C-terminal domain-containing protein [Prauserella muralis]
MEITEALLPGVGIRYEFSTAHGDRVGIVVSRNEDAFDVVTYPPGEEETSRPAFRLTRTEADAVIEILGVPQLSERLADLTRDIPGLAAAEIDIPADSVHAGATLGDTRARTRTGATVVAVVHDGTVIPAPSPRERLCPGDVLVVLGTHAGIARLRRILTSTAPAHAAGIPGKEQ